MIQYAQGRKEEMPRKLFAVLLVISLVGIAACDLFKHDYKLFVLACLFAAANVLIFLVE